MPPPRTCLAIDLKSFYASVECVDRGLDPLDTCLVVADTQRSEKTICLAVTPPLKKLGVTGRPRLFEVHQQVQDINARRASAAGIHPTRLAAPGSASMAELTAKPNCALTVLTAKPRMARYIQVSSKICQIYFQYFEPRHVHVYSIDEVFIEATPYMRMYGCAPRELAQRIIAQILRETGITATAGIGTNLYLAKVAMDIVAKHATPDASGARIAQLDDTSFRHQLWDHQPLEDFWRIGHGIAAKLRQNHIHTLGQLARYSTIPSCEERLYRLFGVNAELLIDHAWGYEPCTIDDIKAFRPTSQSVSSGQVLQEALPYAKALLVVREMADQLALDLVARRCTAGVLSLQIGYEHLKEASPPPCGYDGKFTIDHYGRIAPASAHGGLSLGRNTASAKVIVATAKKLFQAIVHPDLAVRRITLVAGKIAAADAPPAPKQLLLFPELSEQPQDESAPQEKREHQVQEALLKIKDRYGKNAILKAMNLEEGATGKMRNQQIGGHNA